MGKKTYLRFVVLKHDRDSQVEQGLFAAMDELEYDDQIYPYEEELKKEISKWFSRNLNAPDVLAGKHYERKAKAISWFKDSAHEYIEKMRSYVQILENHDYKVKQILTERPGKIIYEDDHQIAAIPFKDTFK